MPFLPIASAFGLLFALASSLASASSFDVKARVDAVEPSSGTIRIQLLEADAALPEGSFSVRVSPGDLHANTGGKTIRGRLFESLGVWRLEHIWPADEMENRLLEEINRRLRRDTAGLRRRNFRNVGDYLPPFALWDQQGTLVTHESLKGHPFVLNFIFTRCLVDRMCPASSRRMVQLQNELAAGGLDEARLVTISFDPSHDTPGILYQYGLDYGMDFDRFTLLSGPQAAINDLLIQFGIITVEEDGTIDHTMATLLVDETGRIIHRREGSQWRAEEFRERLETMASAR